LYRLDAALRALVDLNAEAAHGLAMQIDRVRQRTTRIAFALDAGCALVTVVAGIALVRALSRYEQVVNQHRDLLERRSQELEQFAGRVAHDVLNPIAAAQLLAGAAGRQAAPEPELAAKIGR